MIYVYIDIVLLIVSFLSIPIVVACVSVNAYMICIIVGNTQLMYGNLEEYNDYTCSTY